MTPELNSHQLARLCIDVLKSYNTPTAYDPYYRNDSIRNCRSCGVTVISISRNSVGCKYQGREYNFRYQTKAFRIISASEYYNKKIHYFGKGY